MNFQVKNESELIERVWDFIKGRNLSGFRVALIGDLGSGKTTLVKGIAKKLAIPGEVTSPTFSISKRYEVGSSLVPYLQHLDLYRFESPDLRNIKEIDDIISDNQSLSFVEWPERMDPILKKMNILIKISIIDDHQRSVRIEEPDES